MKSNVALVPSSFGGIINVTNYLLLGGGVDGSNHRARREIVAERMREFERICSRRK